MDRATNLQAIQELPPEEQEGLLNELLARCVPLLTKKPLDAIMLVK